MSLILAIGAAGACRAQTDLVSPSRFSGVLDVRAVAADGERSFLDGGFGKLRFGGGTRLTVAEAALAWQPRLTDHVAAVVTVAAQDGADPVVDLSEAYLTWRGEAAGLRLSGRAGMMWPAASLEHDGLLWTVPDTVTPSALTSWIGEEGKLIGAELTARGDLAGQGLAATVGVFGWGDTSGTLLSFRGWALHDLKSTQSGTLDLPQLSPFIDARQAPFTTALLELDDRAGLYGRLEWRPDPRLTLDLFAYDNRGDRTSVNADREWAWDTRFVQAGVQTRLSPRTRLRAQVLLGETAMGRIEPVSGQVWVDVEARAAYVSVTHDMGPGALTARLDLFETRDRSIQALDDNDERGGAALAAYRWDVGPRADLVFELLATESRRPARVLAGEAPRQVQTQGQIALRTAF